MRSPRCHTSSCFYICFLIINLDLIDDVSLKKILNERTFKKKMYLLSQYKDIPFNEENTKLDIWYIFSSSFELPRDWTPYFHCPVSVMLLFKNATDITYIFRFW